jgi:hypothetical protein
MARNPGFRGNTGAGSGMGRDTVRGHQDVGTTDERLLNDAEIVEELRGNRITGNDQQDVENARQSPPNQQDEEDPDYPSNDENVTGRPGHPSKSSQV